MTRTKGQYLSPIGVLSATNFITSGVGTIANTRGVNANYSGIATFSDIRVGSAITINSTGINAISGIGTFSQIRVGSAATINATGISISGIATLGTIQQSTFKNCNDRIYAYGNTGTAANIDLSNGNFVTATLTGNCTFTFTIGNSVGASSFTLFLTNDSVAGRSIVWPVSVKWPNSVTPVRTTTANATDVYSFFTLDSGTTWYGMLSIYNYA